MTTVQLSTAEIHYNQYSKLNIFYIYITYIVICTESELS